jgi:hypothetical protein
MRFAGGHARGARERAERERLVGLREGAEQFRARRDRADR